jgi:hypothetical protein
MDEKTTYWASIILGGAALLLLIVNMSLINGNRQLQDEISQRQKTINSGPTLDQINRGIVQALADIATRDNDTQARGLLSAQGITVNAPAKSDDTNAKKKPEKSDE